MKESGFKLLGYRIQKIDFDISDHYGKEPENLSQEINIENNFSKEKPRTVEVVLNITVKAQTGSLNIFVKLKGIFEAQDSMSEETFQILAKQNGPAILFPFARAIITSYTAQANIPPVIMPTVNFTIKKENKNLV